MIALRTDVDCKYTRFNQSLSAISLFFKLWHAFTDYKGVEEGLHKFQVSSMEKNKERTLKKTGKQITAKTS